MRGFVQTVFLLVALAFGDALVHFGGMDVAAGFLLAAVAFRADFIQLFIVPAIALEPTDVVAASLVGEACCQRLDAQVEGDNAIAHRMCLALRHFDIGGEFKKWGKIPQKKSFFSSRWGISTTFDA